MNFNYFNPVKLITGEGCVRKNAAEFAALGKSCLIITSGSAAKKSGALDDVTAALQSVDIPYMVFDGIGQNPTVESCMEAGKIARDNRLEFIVGIGGGSPLDASKAAAVYATNEMENGVDVYNLNWPNMALPFALVGTTAGTGSEVTSFSILTMPNGRKKSFGNAQTYPRVMFGDARYTYSLPLKFTVSTALDALAHSMEAYFSSASNLIADMYAIEAAKILYPELRLLQSAKTADDITSQQRERLYYASILAGFALSQCGTLYCHTLGYYLSEEYEVPHGTACAATLPDLVLRGNKYAPERAAAIFENAGAPAGEVVSLIKSLTVLPPIKIPKDVIEWLARDGATTKNFSKTIPDGYTFDEAKALLTELFGE